MSACCIPDEISIGVCVNDPSVTDGKEFTVEKYIHALKRIALHGFKAIEYSHVSHLNESECRQIREATLRLGMTPWSVHSEHLNAPDNEAIREYYRQQEICARNIASLGGKVMVFHPPNAALTKEQKAAVIRQVVEICLNHGIRSAIENCILPIGEFCELVNMADHSNLGYAFDSGHAGLLDGAQKVLEGMGNRVWTTHLQDNFGKNDDHLPPGLGILDWRKILTRLWQNGYTGPLLVELTGSGVKAKRSVAELRDLPLEVEQVLAIGYLKYLHRVLRENLPFFPGT